MEKIITKIETNENLTLIATFADGEIVSFDVKSMFEKYPVFKQLQDEFLFSAVKIDGIGYGISWNDELDLSSEGIYSKGKHIGKTDPDINILLGLNVSKARMEKGISQRELSKKSGLIQSEISKIEQGKGNPTIITLQKIAKSLGKSISSLVI